MINLPRKEQFIGCLIGQCLGDALGYPVEGRSPEICSKYVENVLKPIYESNKVKPEVSFGQYTDDSQLARELVISYIECKGFDPRDYAKRIAKIFAEDRIVGRGRATELAAERLIKGVRWEDAGTPPPSAGNGTAMRAGPVGLMFFDDPQKLILSAKTQGLITHRDNRCSAGSLAIAGAVAIVLQTKEINAYQFLEKICSWTIKLDRSFTEFIDKLGNWIKLPPQEAVEYISKAGVEPRYLDDWQKISPFVITSVLWSLYSFLRTPDDYWETICTSIAVGGDVDTTAAMAGAISGAYNGIRAIPSHLAVRLTDRGEWNYSELVDLANRCYDLKMSKIDSETNPNLKRENYG